MINIFMILFLLSLIYKINFTILILLAILLLISVRYILYLIIKTIILSFLVLLLLGGGLFFLLSYLVLINKSSTLSTHKAINLLIFFIIIIFDSNCDSVMVNLEHYRVWIFNSKFIGICIFLVFLILYFIVIINLFLDVRIRAIRRYI